MTADDTTLAMVVSSSTIAIIPEDATIRKKSKRRSKLKKDQDNNSLSPTSILTSLATSVHPQEKTAPLEGAEQKAARKRLKKKASNQRKKLKRLSLQNKDDHGLTAVHVLPSAFRKKHGETKKHLVIHEEPHGQEPKEHVTAEQNVSEPLFSMDISETDLDHIGSDTSAVNVRVKDDCSVMGASADAREKACPSGDGGRDSEGQTPLGAAIKTPGNADSSVQEKHVAFAEITVSPSESAPLHNTLEIEVVDKADSEDSGELTVAAAPPKSVLVDAESQSQSPQSLQSLKSQEQALQLILTSKIERLARSMSSEIEQRGGPSRTWPSTGKFRQLAHERNSQGSGIDLSTNAGFRSTRTIPVQPRSRPEGLRYDLEARIDSPLNPTPRPSHNYRVAPSINTPTSEAPHRTHPSPSVGPAVSSTQQSLLSLPEAPAEQEGPVYLPPHLRKPSPVARLFDPDTSSIPPNMSSSKPQESSARSGQGSKDIQIITRSGKPQQILQQAINRKRGASAGALKNNGQTLRTQTAPPTSNLNASSADLTTSITPNATQLEHSSTADHLLSELEVNMRVVTYPDEVHEAKPQHLTSSPAASSPVAETVPPKYASQASQTKESTSRNQSKTSFGMQAYPRAGRNNNKWARARDLKAKPEKFENESDAYASDIPSVAEADIGSDKAREKSISPEDDNHFQHQLAGWDGDWAPAPVEWDGRPAFADTKFHERVDSWMAPLIQLPKSPVNVLDPKFKEGIAHTGGSGELIAPPDAPPETSIDPEDAFSGLHIMQTANTAALEYSNLVLRHERDRKMERKAMRATLARRDANYVPAPNPHAPKVNIYIRPGVLSDIPQLTALYRHFAERSVYVAETSITEHQIRSRFEDVRSSKMPWIVAVKRNTTKGQHRHQHHEIIVGYGFGEDYHSPKDAYRYSAEIELYVHHQYRKLGVGKCLLDKLMSLLDSAHLERGGYDWVCNDVNGEYGPGGTRVIGTVICSIAHLGKDKTEIDWIKKWLERWEFVQVGTLTRVGWKFDSPVDVAILQLTTGVRIEPNRGM
ncbi:MAG: hypothetical protein M1819_005284 [Sarea resinae]|nr:MAG: hypothetical protein M1819_005284 [Sarea resinae]